MQGMAFIDRLKFGVDMLHRSRFIHEISNPNPYQVTVPDNIVYNKNSYPPISIWLRIDQITTHTKRNSRQISTVYGRYGYDWMTHIWCQYVA